MKANKKKAVKKNNKWQKISEVFAFAGKASELITKVRITTFLDGDILKALKDEAAAQGVGYQTLLNLYLRKSVIEKNNFENEVLARLNRIESTQFLTAQRLNAMTVKSTETKTNDMEGPSSYLGSRIVFSSPNTGGE